MLPTTRRRRLPSPLWQAGRAVGDVVVDPAEDLGDAAVHSGVDPAPVAVGHDADLLKGARTCAAEQYFV